jgi:ParB family transcriptional regulator, chromosome partitioning protein
LKLFYSQNTQGVLENIQISQIRPFKFYYRNDDNNDNDDKEIKNLEVSIQQHGLLQPIIVRHLDHFYEIVTGHRRYKACKALGWKKILCHIIHVDDKEAFEISLMSNIQRKQLNPIEEAQAFDKYLSNYKWGDVSELAQRIGKSRSYIYRRLKLLDFPLDMINAISNSNVDPSIVEELSSIKDNTLKETLANDVLENKYSCMQIRQLKKVLDDDDDDDKQKINDTNYYFEKENKKIFTDKDLAEIEKNTQRLFNKMIILLKNSSRNMMPLIEDSEENWIVYNTFMQHKKMIDNQIDILIKEKKKIKYT